VSPVKPQASGPPLAEHVNASVDALTAFHREHYRSASRLQNLIDRITDRLGRPLVVVTLICAILLWTAGTVFTTGGRVDQPGFAWLELAGTLAALLVSILILVTQRREDQLAARREQLTLELALIADKKTAKLISLIEELRRDHPGVVDRTDAESEEMARPADAKSVLAAIDRQSGRGPIQKS
jgi:uncharacterized membrane protein